MEYLNELLNILNAMSPYLLLGFLIAGLLHVYIPRLTFLTCLSRKGFKSAVMAALVGVPLPLCSCGVIPTAMSLKKEGATDGATVSFLIATPQTGVDSILATYGVLGLPFAIIRPIVAFVVGVLGGLFVDRFSKKKHSAVDSKQKNNANEGNAKKLTLMDGLRYGFVDMLQDLGMWFTVGLVIAAAITAFVPSGLFDILSEHYVLNIVVVLGLSIPMYICSTGSIPIVLSLLMKGISPGAALVFLMAGPATNIATLTVLKKVLGTRTTALYLMSIILGAIGFALLIDFALPVEWFVSKLSAVSTAGDGCSAAPWWHIAASILFVVLLANAYIQKFMGKKCGAHTHDCEVVISKRFKVSDMHCSHCKANVEQAVLNLEDVISVAIDLSDGLVEVEGAVSEEAVCKAIKELGFEVEIC